MRKSFIKKIIDEMQHDKRSSSTTQEEKQIMEQCRQKWEDIILDTTPIDREKTEEIVDLFYQHMDLPNPKKYIWFDSPHQATKYIIEEFKKQPEYKNVSDVDLFSLIDNIRDELMSLDELAFLDYFLNLSPNPIDIPDGPAVKALIKIGEMVGISPWWPFDDRVVLTERYCEVHFDEENKLHNENGPSVAWRDDIKLFHHHGHKLN